MFKSPFQENVQGYLETAVSICFDGCHKIYIAMDDASHDRQIEYGYAVIRVIDKKKALDQLYRWFNDSCGLRFIQVIGADGSRFTDAISQFEYPDDDEE